MIPTWLIYPKNFQWRSIFTLRHFHGFLYGQGEIALTYNIINHSVVTISVRTLGGETEMVILRQLFITLFWICFSWSGGTLILVGKYNLVWHTSKLGHQRVTTSPISTWVWLLIHAIISFKACQKQGPQMDHQEYSPRMKPEPVAFDTAGRYFYIWKQNTTVCGSLFSNIHFRDVSSVWRRGIS